MISSMHDPASRFSNTADTGIRVPRNTHAPLRLPGTLSTAGHRDQSRVAMFLPRPILTLYHGSPARIVKLTGASASVDFHSSLVTSDLAPQPKPCNDHRG